MVTNQTNKTINKYFIKAWIKIQQYDFWKKMNKSTQTNDAQKYV